MMSDVTDHGAESPESETDETRAAGPESVRPGSTDGTHVVAPPPEGARRWYRSEERVIAGVAGGLAESLALDPLLVRLGFVGLTLLDGFGIAAYVAGWLVMAPRRGAPFRRGLPRFAGIAVLAIALISIAAQLWGGEPGWGTFVLLLVGGAVALWHPRRTGQAAPDPGVPPAPATWAPPGQTRPPVRPIVVVPERAPVSAVRPTPWGGSRWRPPSAPWPSARRSAAVIPARWRWHSPWRRRSAPWDSWSVSSSGGRTG